MTKVNDDLMNAIKTNEAIGGEHVRKVPADPGELPGPGEVPLAPAMRAVCDRLGLDGEVVLTTIMEHYENKGLPKIVSAALVTGFLEGYVARVREERE